MTHAMHMDREEQKYDKESTGRVLLWLWQLNYNRKLDWWKKTIPWRIIAL